MQMGYNTDVEHRGITVHVQTEDHGLGGRKITTQVFCSGRILDSRTISYAEAIAAIVDEEAQGQEITKRMRAIHKHFMNRVREGVYDTKLPLDDQEIAAAPPAPVDTVRPSASLTAELDPVDILDDDLDEVLLAPTNEDSDNGARSWRGLEDDFNGALANALRKAMGI